MNPNRPAAIRSRRSSMWAVPLAAALLCLGAGGPGHVYTNEDLDRLAPLPKQESPIAQTPDNWDLLFRLLDRQERLLERQRQDELERERLEILARQTERTPSHPVFRYGHVGFFPFPGAFMPPLHAPVPPTVGPVRPPRSPAPPGHGVPSPSGPPQRPGARG